MREMKRNTLKGSTESKRERKHTKQENLHQQARNVEKLPKLPPKGSTGNNSSSSNILPPQIPPRTDSGPTKQSSTSFNRTLSEIIEEETCVPSTQQSQQQMYLANRQTVGASTQPSEQQMYLANRQTDVPSTQQMFSPDRQTDVPSTYQVGENMTTSSYLVNSEYTSQNNYSSNQNNGFNGLNVPGTHMNGGYASQYNVNSTQQQYNSEPVAGETLRSNETPLRGTDTLRSRSRSRSNRLDNLQGKSDLLAIEGPYTEAAVIGVIKSRVINNTFQTFLGPSLVSVCPPEDTYHVTDSTTDSGSLGSSSDSTYLASRVESGHRSNVQSNRVDSDAHLGTDGQQGQTTYPQNCSLEQPRRDDLTNLGQPHKDSLSPLEKFSKRIIREHRYRNVSQSVVISGVSGSGKSCLARKIINQLFRFGGGGCETDMYKHLQAALTVLRPFGECRTKRNHCSSKMGYYVQSLESFSCRTRINCIFLDQGRVCSPPVGEGNFNIFLELVAGLLSQERMDLGVGEFLQDFSILQGVGEDQWTSARESFQTWRNALSMLGISFRDVVQVLSAILHLGNLSEEDCNETNPRILLISRLLGLSPSTLVSGLTVNLTSVKGETVELRSNRVKFDEARDSLMKSLYVRTLLSILKRINSLQPNSSSLNPASNSFQPSSYNSFPPSSNGVQTSNFTMDSSKDPRTVSGFHPTSEARQPGVEAKENSTSPDSGRGRGRSSSSYIGILDMFGLPYQSDRVQNLEELFMNFCSEAIYNFFITHTIRMTSEACRDENIETNLVDFYDNSPVIQLVSQPKCGLLSILDLHTVQHGRSDQLRHDLQSILHRSPPDLINHLSGQQGQQGHQSDHTSHMSGYQGQQHDRRSSGRDVKVINGQFLVDGQLLRTGQDIQGVGHMTDGVNNQFCIEHFTGPVTYTTDQFTDCNRDRLPARVVRMFDYTTCSSGFVSHLFHQELKSLDIQGNSSLAESLRISPGTDISTTLSQDFHCKLDTLLRLLVQTKPHFVVCIQPSTKQNPQEFDRQLVAGQVRAFQLLESMNFYAGLAHKLKIRSFFSRYRILYPGWSREGRPLPVLHQVEVSPSSSRLSVEEVTNRCTDLVQRLGAEWTASSAGLNKECKIGGKYVFFTEGARQYLEYSEECVQERSSSLIQKWWRQKRCRRRSPLRSLPAGWDLPHTPTNNNISSYLTNNNNSKHSFINSMIENNNNTSTTEVQQKEMNRMQGDVMQRAEFSIEQKSDIKSDQNNLDLVARTINLHGLQMEIPPPLPPRRNYTVKGNQKIFYNGIQTIQ